MSVFQQTHNSVFLFKKKLFLDIFVFYILGNNYPIDTELYLLNNVDWLVRNLTQFIQVLVFKYQKNNISTLSIFAVPFQMNFLALLF